MTALRVMHVEAGRHLYGGALQVALLIDGLAARGVHNVLVCPEDSAIATVTAADRVVTLPMHGEIDVTLAWRLARLLRAQRPDLLHLHSRRGADLWGGIAARLAGVPSVLTRRVDNPEPRWLARAKYRLFDRVVVISRGIGDVLEREGVDAARMACVRSAIDTSRYAGRACDRAAFTRAFELPDDAPVGGVIAQLIPRKGHRLLIEAMPGILRAHPRLSFVFFGQGPQRQALERQCRELGLDEHVRFAGFRTDLEQWLPCLDLVVHPAQMEGLGIALLQAAACGRPVVAVRAGGMPEAVRDGETGVLVEAGDVAGLGAAVSGLLDEPARARRMGEAGAAMVAREFGVDAMVEGNLAVYRAVLGTAG